MMKIVFSFPSTGQGLESCIVVHSKSSELLDQIVRGEQLDHTGMGFSANCIASVSLKLRHSRNSVSLRSGLMDNSSSLSNSSDLGERSHQCDRGSSQEDKSIETEMVSGDVTVARDNVSCTSHLAREICKKLFAFWKVKFLLPLGCVSLLSGDLAMELADSEFLSESSHFASLFFV